MNIGLKHCTGEIIGILNSDDIFLKNTLKIVAKYFNKQKLITFLEVFTKAEFIIIFFPQKLWYTFNIYPSHSVSFFIKNKTQKRLENTI